MVSKNLRNISALSVRCGEKPLKIEPNQFVLKIIKIITHILLFLVLTILTQIGGIAYLIYLGSKKYLEKFTSHRAIRSLYRSILFLLIYSIISFGFVPFIAASLGRVQLPLFEQHHLKPLNRFTFLLNRNYVSPELKQTTFRVAEELNKKFPGTVVNYLDAGFPFFDGFPLFPHLSHNDGKKLDLAFLYIDAGSQSPTNETPSFIGYGISEEPRANEINTANNCASQGYWQYSFLKKVVPQSYKQDYIFDSIRTKELVNSFAKQESIKKLFIEPHLKTRLKLPSSKIRFHGCGAVRHDDHLHVEIR